MAMVVGLHSGKEFLVKDNSYILYPEGGMMHVFTSVDGKRRITVDHNNVEYLDEVNSEEREDYLVKMAAIPPTPKVIGVDYV